MKLFPYQEKIRNEARKILDDEGLVILTLEMRTGKTPIALSLAEGRTLFATTKSAIPDIEKMADSAKKTDTLVVNYESLHKVNDRDFDYIVLDEHHKLSAYPRPTKRIKDMRRIVERQRKTPKFILLSGTPAAESMSQWFHPLWLTRHHPFARYKNFYDWFRTFGIPGEKMIGYGRVARDYSQTVDFMEEYIEPWQIKLRREDTDVFKYPNVKIKPVKVYLTDRVRAVYSNMETYSVAMLGAKTSMASTAAVRLNKLQQLAGGHLIMDSGTVEIIDPFKLLSIPADRENDVFMYKFLGMKKILTDHGCRHVYNIDATEGLDLSNRPKIWIMELTWKASQFIQAIDRLARFDRDTEMSVHPVIAADTVDPLRLDAVLKKKDFNLRYYRHHRSRLPL